MREFTTGLGPLLALVVAVCVAGCAAVRPTAAAPTDAIALAVLPRVGLGPRDVSVTVRVDKDPANRNVCLAFVQDEVDVIATCHSMDGANHPRFWQHLFGQVHAGAYDVQVRVTRADGSVRRVSVSVCYAGQFVESCGPSESVQ